MQRRQRLHAQMGLPSDRPLLRIANALAFREPGRALAAAATNSRLADVHVGLPSYGVPGGSAHLIDGSYDYYHYMQVWQPLAACSKPVHRAVSMMPLLEARDALWMLS